MFGFWQNKPAFRGSAINGIASAGRVKKRIETFVRRCIVGFFLLCGTLVSMSAHANIACEMANSSLNLVVGTISLPVNTPVGTTLGNVQPSTFQMTCQFVNRVNSATSATNYANLATSRPLAPGYTDVYTTNVAGVGVRYTFDSSDCQASNVVLTNGTAQVGCYFSGPIGGPVLVANITATPTLIAIGPIAAGTSSLSTAATVGVTYTSSDQAGSYQKANLFTGTASGAFVHATCSVSQLSTYVSLATADTNAFAAGNGTVFAPTPFSLTFACSAGAKVSMTLTDNVNPANRSNTLQLASDSTAKGVGIQVLNSSGPVSFGADSAMPGNPNQWLIGASPNGQLQVPLTARYISTGTVSPGTVKALATFTMSYQ